MNDDIVFMMKIYGTYDIDWMGDEIKSSSDLTRHHIIKKEDGGENGILNYALLTTRSHHLMHYLEDNDYNTYCIINNMFLELNRSCKPPTVDYYSRMRAIIKKVKKEIKYNNRRRR